MYLLVMDDCLLSVFNWLGLVFYWFGFDLIVELVVWDLFAYLEVLCLCLDLLGSYDLFCLLP